MEGVCEKMTLKVRGRERERKRERERERERDGSNHNCNYRKETQKIPRKLISQPWTRLINLD